MTHANFSKIVAAAQAGKTQAFNQFFKLLYKDCKQKLLYHVSTETEAEEAFSEAMLKFWKAFVVEGKPLPQNNIKGYIFTMAKYYAINQQRHKKRYPTVSDEEIDQTKNEENKTEADYQKEQNKEDNHQEALKLGVQKLGTRCRKLFEYILKNETDKPRDLWQPLGYKNAATLRSVKSECHKKLKIKVILELERIKQRENVR